MFWLYISIQSKDPCESTTCDASHHCIGSLCDILKCVLTPCQANNMSLIVNSEICSALLRVHASVKTDCFFRTFQNLVAIRFSLSSSALRTSLKEEAVCWRETILPLSFYVNCTTFFQENLIKIACPCFQVFETTENSLRGCDEF